MSPSAQSALPATSAANTEIDIQPGASASFFVAYTNCLNPVEAPTVVGNASVDFTLPGKSAPISLALGTTEVSCSDQQVSDAPLQAGVVSSLPGFVSATAGSAPAVQSSATTGVRSSHLP